MKILDSMVVTESKYLNLVAVTYEDQKGNTKQWYMVSRGKQPKCITGKTQQPEAAIIVPYHRQKNKLVVIREFRIPIGGYQYSFPAGLLDPGEDLAVSAGRELHEETGLDLVKVYRCSPAVFSSAGLTDEAVAVVFAEVMGTPDVDHNEDSEDIEVFIMDRDEVRDLTQRRDIVFGARAWLIMDAFVRMGESYLTGA